jgi:hypothetical protein
MLSTLGKRRGEQFALLFPAIPTAYWIDLTRDVTHRANI